MGKKEYNEKLALLENSVPEHPMLNMLRRGHSTINAMYLEKALESLPQAPREKKMPSTKDGIYNALMIRKSNLFTERNKLSNQFKKCKTIAERAEVSDAIAEVQQKIKAHFDDIQYYEKNGKLRTKPDKSLADMDIPKDRYKLRKKIHSLRTSISNFKKELDQLFEEGGHNIKRIKKVEQHLSKHKNSLKYALRVAGEKSGDN